MDEVDRKAAQDAIKKKEADRKKIQRQKKKEGDAWNKLNDHLKIKNRQGRPRTMKTIAEVEDAMRDYGKEMVETMREYGR